MCYTKILAGNHILLHIPHASLIIPSEDRKHILLNDDDLEKEKIIMTDLHIDKLCKDIDANFLISDISRLIVDMERYEDDKKEPMAVHGMGVVYTSTHDANPLRILSDEYRTELISKYYRSYHNELKTMCEKIVERHGKCLIIDMHSFPTKPLFCHNYAYKLPDICIGFNGSKNLLAEAYGEYFKKQGMSVEFNYPFSGSMMPSGLNTTVIKKVDSIMIEINRKLFLNEKTGICSSRFYFVQNIIKDFITNITK